MKELFYKSTRNSAIRVTASQAILKGLSDEGGLFIPERIPALERPIEDFADMTYAQTAYEVMSRFYTDFTGEELKSGKRGNIRGEKGGKNKKKGDKDIKG